MAVEPPEEDMRRSQIGEAVRLALEADPFVDVDHAFGVDDVIN